MRSWVVAVLAVLSLANGSTATAQQAYWQCAYFARHFSGIDIRGDAWTWWGLAEGRYQRGQRPRVGAVLAFQPSGGMVLGHVATVTRIVGARDIVVTHANWSPINGTRGQIERDVAVRDVSDANDWSRVRVWYAPIADLGTTAWPVSGFIYPTRAGPLNFAAETHILPRAAAPRLAYARLDTLQQRERPSLLSADVVRMARAEGARRGFGGDATLLD